jgi:hypothetical protein
MNVGGIAHVAPKQLKGKQFDIMLASAPLPFAAIDLEKAQNM